MDSDIIRPFRVFPKTTPLHQYPSYGMPPLCEGDLVCCVHLESDSLDNMAMEFSTDRGRSWTYFGNLDPINSTQAYRQLGELWRLRNVETGQVVAQAETRGKRLVIRAPRMWY